MRLWSIAGVGAALSLSLSAVTAHAQDHWTATPEGYANHLGTVGSWQFSARKKGPDGKPECVEGWNFAKDGTGQVTSGTQTVRLSWRYVKDDVLGMVLRINYESSTAGKDCLAREVDPSFYPKDNGPGFELLFRNSGASALVCSAPQVVVDEHGDIRKGADGKPMTLQSLENCWGELTPIAEV